MFSVLMLSFNGMVYMLVMVFMGFSGIVFDVGKLVGIDVVWGFDIDGFVLSSGFGSFYLVDMVGNFGSVMISVSLVLELVSWVLGLVGFVVIGLLVNCCCFRY